MAGGILVVGAGPTGLTAAVELARLGLRPTVIEARGGPSPLSRAVGILPHSMNVLAPSGAAKAIREEAVVVSSARFHAGARSVARLPLDHGPGAQLLALPQDRTEHHLRASLERLGGRVHYGQRLETLAEEERAVTVRINGRLARYSHVIGADGAGSTVRAALGLAYEGFDLPERWSIADVDLTGWAHPTAFHAFLLRGQRAVVVIPLGPARVRVISNTGDALVALPVDMRVETQHRADTFRISVRQAERYGTRRVFLAGDAAHCHSPVGGRGMNLGIADAADLARRFSAGSLQGYHAARHEEGARVIAQSERARRALVSGGAFRRALVLSALSLAGAAPPLARALARRVLDA